MGESPEPTPRPLLPVFLGYKGEIREPPAEGGHTLLQICPSAWHSALAWGHNSIFQLTQERDWWLCYAQFPNKADKYAENLIL